MRVTTIGPHWLHVAAGKKKSFRLKRKKNLCVRCNGISGDGRVPKNGLPKNGQAGISPKNKNDPGWKNELRTVHHTQRAFAVKTTSSAALLGLRNGSTSTV